MIDDATLYQADGDNVIATGNAVTVGLSLNELSRSVRPGSRERYLKDDIRKFLEEHGQSLLVRVDVDIEESGHIWDPLSHRFVVQRSDTVPAANIEDFILGRLPDVDTP